MSSRTMLPAVVTAVTALILQAILSPTVVVAQQDSTMMSHDSAMTMQSDSAMMPHDSMKMDHSQMMEHDQMGAGNGMMFTGLGGQKAAGTYALTESGGKRHLTLSNDFTAAAAPDLYLVLANDPVPGTEALYLGKLKKATGGQTFELPKGKDLSGYTTLLVWSKKDKRAVASAEWHPTLGKMTDHM